ncbi:FliM/FliN family flagellar motor switch protein [Parvularcula marina]|jgi:flagellar motor switch/type III secretory pathway protein FliN|uniref:FliM/FliN family flagellar motor switch protein n=1 Tax=Parvularcula marina TaxID=2292771 RepID=A0A371RH08_9PROT|nr:FliM/FliN family flagellar motor C-terminal domain-containing protein [Parvularcula marina]RFB04741.1 FliM/FliN family flagellar motor switch protein [Parvularcula marina]
MSDALTASSNDPLYDIQLPVTVVVGQVTLSLADLSKWEADTIVALGVKTSEPVELQVNGKVVATGELCEGQNGPNSLAVRILDIRKDSAHT